jgi:ABC-type antimicrobial peptide transport system permease subunit
MAVAGIYGMMAYAVTLRIHEIGARIALVARPSDALKLIIRQGMTPALIGMGIGLLFSVGLTRLMANLLFEASAADPATFVLIVLSRLDSVAGLLCPSAAGDEGESDDRAALRMSPTQHGAARYCGPASFCALSKSQLMGTMSLVGAPKKP